MKQKQPRRRQVRDEIENINDYTFFFLTLFSIVKPAAPVEDSKGNFKIINPFHHCDNLVLATEIPVPMPKGVPTPKAAPSSPPSSTPVTKAAPTPAASSPVPPLSSSSSYASSGRAETRVILILWLKKQKYTYYCPLCR